MFLPQIFKFIYHNSFIISKCCIDGHVGYLHIFAIIKTAMVSVSLAYGLEFF